ncbi:MAG: cytochrome ubiquinol oxidase subunit I [Methylococcales bacterium]|nr:cytochrome ubiquinol oxidase subunit I [Methylococcales bacterium]
MISETVLALSYWQFALAGVSHFLFMPLTLGLAIMLAIMETAYVLSGQEAYATGCRFWGRLFAVNFVLAIATRLALFFQFGMYGSYFADYAGDVFALPLAIEAVSTFFPAAILFGPFLCGWDQLGKKQHLLVTWLLAVSVTLSALWMTVAYGWLQNPVAAEFNPQSYRIELVGVTQLLNNPLLVSKFLHTLCAACTTGAATVLAICAWRLLSNPADSPARIGYRLAAAIGLVSTLLLGMGDTTPHMDNPVQNLKLAILDGKQLAGRLADIETHIRNGMKAYGLLQTLRDENKDTQILADFTRLKTDLGYALLLQRRTEHVADATDTQIAQAAQAALPAHPALIVWSFRLMIVSGLIMMLIFAISVRSVRRGSPPPAWLLKLGIYLFPLSWLASLAGWLVSEAGKQPWAVAGVLPAFMSVSSLSAKELAISMSFTLITALALPALAVFLIKNMFKTTSYPLFSQGNRQ